MRQFMMIVATILTVTTAGLAYAAEEALKAATGMILDPAAHNLIRLESLVLGSETDSAHMAPKEYRLTFGQGYRWKIKASDQSEYAFVAPAFFRNIWIRKVEAGDVEIKSATLDEMSSRTVAKPNSSS